MTLEVATPMVGNCFRNMSYYQEGKRIEGKLMKKLTFITLSSAVPVPPYSLAILLPFYHILFHIGNVPSQMQSKSGME
jgi:hypothetical protein